MAHVNRTSVVLAVVAVLLLCTGCGQRETVGPLGITGDGWVAIVALALVLAAGVLREVVRVVGGRGSWRRPAQEQQHGDESPRDAS